MLANPSFLADMVQPSPYEKISRAISFGVRLAYPSSLILMNQAFSAKRQASKNSGIPWARQSLETALMFSMLTGSPPTMLFVMVIITSGILARQVDSFSSSFSIFMFPLNGTFLLVSIASGVMKLIALPPCASMLAKVVAKWALFGTISPSDTEHRKRMRSAARPWCAGITWRYPKISLTTCSNFR